MVNHALCNSLFCIVAVNCTSAVHYSTSAIQYCPVLLALVRLLANMLNFIELHRYETFSSTKSFFLLFSSRFLWLRYSL